MKLNADFTERVAIHTKDQDWIASPMPGVERQMLDRIGDEVARATTIVRYAPGSHFSPHVHDGGEEFIVLDGVFQDEHGDFPAGSYIRNPPTSSHTPGAEAGCVIFVKLWQFDPDDRTPVKIDMNKMASVRDATRDGVSVMPLFRDVHEDVRLETWEPGTAIELDVPSGAEFLVINGTFVEGGETFTQHSWLRLPKGSKLSAVAGPDGANVWVKTGHLTNPQAPKA